MAEIGILVLCVGLTILFALGMAKIRERRLGEQAKKFGYAELADLSPEQIPHEIKLRHELSAIPKGTEPTITSAIVERIGSSIFGLFLLAGSASQLFIEPSAKQRVDQYLCHIGDVCRRYDEVRLECATAGSFKTCLRVKMDNDASLIPACASEEGAPAIMPPKLPNRAVCYFVSYIGILRSQPSSSP
ncbi:hypothetical protein [Bradyrhizobium sp. SZCCHNR1075]|uniref:hypothetical protein n=1 Tax=Bradyrhizobium sp. SZCCHNR1075 TaxID=3057362 RepID=UPI0028EA187C|nr:hypothetical protein [Bradyrhizobium sp. SZCCHNR1075]